MQSERDRVGFQHPGLERCRLCRESPLHTAARSLGSQDSRAIPACETDTMRLASDVAGFARRMAYWGGSVQPGSSSRDRPQQFGGRRRTFRVEAREPIEPQIPLWARREALANGSNDCDPRGVHKFVVTVHAPIVAQRDCVGHARICRESRDSHTQRIGSSAGEGEPMAMFAPQVQRRSRSMRKSAARALGSVNPHTPCNVLRAQCCPFVPRPDPSG